MLNWASWDLYGQVADLLATLQGESLGFLGPLFSQKGTLELREKKSLDEEMNIL